MLSLDVRKHSGPIDVVVDSTGLKVFGEGEWKMRKYGKSKRRTWRKLHLAVNPDTQEIEAETLTENSCDDASQVDDLLDQATGKIEGFTATALTINGKSTKPWRNATSERSFRHVGTRRFGSTGIPGERPLSRDLAIREIRRRGRRHMEGKRRLPSPQPFGNGHASDEVLLWRSSEKPFDPKPTNRNTTTKQNPQQIHPPRTPKVRVELVNKALLY